MYVGTVRNCLEINIVLQILELKLFWGKNVNNVSHWPCWVLKSHEPMCALSYSGGDQQRCRKFHFSFWKALGQCMENHNRHSSEWHSLHHAGHWETSHQSWERLELSNEDNLAVIKLYSVCSLVCLLTVYNLLLTLLVTQNLVHNFLKYYGILINAKALIAISNHKMAVNNQVAVLHSHKLVLVKCSSRYPRII